MLDQHEIHPNTETISVVGNSVIDELLFWFLLFYVFDFSV